MAMALALEYIQEYLRDSYGWKVNECGVQPQAQPALDAGSFYVGIEDAGVETGKAETDSLKEILTISIGIWRRPEHLMKDQRGVLKMPQDKYLLGAWTLHDLERAIVVHKTESGVATRFGLHGNWGFLSGLNARYNLPDEHLGAEFIFPLTYRGRGGMETITLEVDGNVVGWYGYRLRFHGLQREQKLRAATHAIG